MIVRWYVSILFESHVQNILDFYCIIETHRGEMNRRLEDPLALVVVVENDLEYRWLVNDVLICHQS